MNKRLSEIRLRSESDKILFYQCDGANSRKPHFPTIWKLEVVSIMFDAAGRISFKLNKVTRYTIEDAEAHEMLDRFKVYMGEERYKRLPAKGKAVTVKSL